MIKPVRYHKKLEGKSNAHLITFDDGNDYVVKFYQPGCEKTLPNEWIGYCLARYLQLPVPFGRIVEIPEDFLETCPQENRETEHKTERGERREIPYQFASRYVPDCVDGHEVAEISKLTNSAMLARIILFDYWLWNRDRTRKNMLFEKENDGVFALWAIDQAEILGGFNWEQDDLESLPSGLIKSTAHKMMTSFIDSEEDFYEQLEVIQTMPILLMEEIVALIPEEWGVTKAERKSIVTTLLHRRHKVLPKQMRRFIHKIYRPLKEEKGSVKD
ncbi:hypothetical protein SAMN05192533_103337 [Mesobacillus persicus]|uniref:HipA-like kinase domain-containing protein n=1 Tax=Mesobacillus persicus TaxID=930146 RepID=A0A1H7ZAV6_9BACI|nr:HipA family kinase [Mesobacillus persicus]SEM55351.1 hypothetical protein SAMN05192533_103337 [Mesobacillus persicus]